MFQNPGCAFMRRADKRSRDNTWIVPGRESGEKAGPVAVLQNFNRVSQVAVTPEAAASRLSWMNPGRPGFEPRESCATVKLPKVDADFRLARHRVADAGKA